jgi:glycerol-3-phosphate acyltransferase PlsY
MALASKIILLAAGYILGSIPFGYLLVRIITGQDVREIESGRTGGTNSMRAAGFGIGFATSMLDILKSAGAVWLMRGFFPDAYWLQVVAGFISVFGHNYSIFMIRKGLDGKLEIGGGAGGTPAIGAIVGFWWPSIFILVPIGYVIVMVIGYASVATLSLPLIGSLLLFILHRQTGLPWEYAFSGLLSELLIVWALRPNIKRLLAGEERLVGFRAKKEPADNKKDPG